MIVYTKEALRRLLEVEFVRFCIVGGSGFIINFILLTLLHKMLLIPAFIAQIFGAEIALFSNFMLHHHWTYRKHKVAKRFLTLLVQFHASSWPAILGSAIVVGALERFLGLSNLVALALSSGVVLVWNFAWSKFIIWRDVRTEDAEELVN